jgi:uncharacterized protein (TIGR00303 family)
VTQSPILFETAVEPGQRLVERWRGETPLFLCVLAHTDTSGLPGISAAGSTEELRVFTPAADAEVLAHGLPRCILQLPSNPLGPPGPSGITRAAVTRAELPWRVLALGLRHLPDAPHEVVPCQPGACIDAGPAVSDARALYELGFQEALRCSAQWPYVVLAESVPAGTTTAHAVLEALGFAAGGRVSGSTADNSHGAKAVLVKRALESAGLTRGSAREDPLLAPESVGDPMQPYAAGFLVGAAQAGLPVMLAGGSQMVAVAALADALAPGEALREVAIGTTRWVSRDPNADVIGLAREVSPTLPLLAADLPFADSRHPGLRQFENFLVKEGVGAGGACLAAHLKTGASRELLQSWIDDAYDSLLGVRVTA